MIPDEREWQAQEKAMQYERAGMELPASDALGAAYLPIARALSKSLEPMLPADFSVRVAAMARAVQRPEEAEPLLERFLLIGLATVFGICALVAVVIYGGNWLGNSFSMLVQLGSPSLACAQALAACLAVSWLSESLRRRRSDHGHSPA